MKNKIAVSLMAAGYLFSNGASASQVACEYDSNSEWPWLDTRVCQLEETPIILNDAGEAVCTDPRADKDGDGWGWENNQSCRIDPTLTKETSDVPALVVEQEDVVVFEQDFETAGVGKYQPETLNRQWDTPIWYLGLNEGRVRVVEDAEKGKALEVLFPANQYGSSGAVAFLNDLSFGVGFERNFEELYVSYDVKFAEDFDFVRGGKLPGLCGYNVNQQPTDGCNTGGGFPTGYDGWSARGMWREDGILENYMYHADQFYQYGDDEYWDVKAVRGKWHSIQHRIVLNTPGEANGIVEAWFDGAKVLSSNTMLYRKTADIGINLFYFSTFYGGADPSWAPSSDQFMYYDNFRIATTPLDDASDTNQKVAATPIETTATDGEAQATATTASDTADANLTPDAVTDTATESLAAASDSLPESQSESQSEPQLGAAQELESGGGAFMPWLLGLVFLSRRKLRVRG